MRNNKEDISYFTQRISSWVSDALALTSTGKITNAQFQYFDAIESGDLEAARKLESQISDLQRVALKKLRGSGTKLAAETLEKLLSESELNQMELEDVRDLIDRFKKLVKTE